MTDPRHQALFEAIAQGDVVFIVGTGASVQATAHASAASWTGLLRLGLAHASDWAKPKPTPAWHAEQEARLADPTLPNLLAVATDLESALNAPDGTEFKTFFDATFARLTASDQALPQALANLLGPRRVLATTNYDTLIVDATGLPGIPWTQSDKAEAVFRGTAQGIVHLHGIHTEAPSVILGTASYDRLRASPHAQALQQAVALLSTIVFIGCGEGGLNDPNLGRLLEWLRLETQSGTHRHFLLCRNAEEEQLRTAFAKHHRLAVLPYGPCYDDLPRFLATFPRPQGGAGRAADSTPFILGRDTDITTLVPLLLSPWEPGGAEGGPTPQPHPPRIRIHGPGGIGKTTLAQALRTHPAIIARYPQRPVAHLENAATADALRAAITSACNLPPTTPFVATLAHLAAHPTLLLLDNLETPFDGETAPTEAVLAELCTLPTLAILATIRGTRPIRGSAWTPHEARPLAEEHQKKLFLSYAGGAISPDDLNLPGFLAALGGLPLAIELVALRAADDTTLADLWSEYRRIGTAIAARDGEPRSRLSALETSIEFSVDSRRMGPEGRRLFALLGALPGGLSDTDRQTLLGPTARPALEQLRATGLAQRLPDRLDLLPPIRDHAARHHPPAPEDAAWPALYLARVVDEGAKRESGIPAMPLTRLVPDLPNIAAALHAAAASSDPVLRRLWDSPASHLHHGDLHHRLGALATAAVAFARGRDAAARSGDDRSLSISHNRLGDIHIAQGDLPAALSSYRAALAIADRLAAADPANTEGQRDLSVSHIKLGDVQVAQGDLPAALSSYRAALANAERLAAADPANALWQRDLSIAHDRRGDVQVAQGDLPAALSSYRAALAIRERLAAADPANAGWQRDLAMSCGKLGITEPDPAIALAHLHRGRDIIRRLVALSPTDATLPHDLARFDASIARRAP